ncbi:hypothetical protein ACFFX0_07020 [Citricoccus parietis]|uniref:Uncharacterized protein n=1 Tax=Citricoccus parietis TaxID=592307 RepID=A0ABV5FWC2_9MICC
MPRVLTGHVTGPDPTGSGPVTWLWCSKGSRSGFRTRRRGARGRPGA